MSIQILQDHPWTWFKQPGRGNGKLSRQKPQNLIDGMILTVLALAAITKNHTSDEDITTGESRDLIIRLKSHCITRMNDYEQSSNFIFVTVKTFLEHFIID